ncbi:cation diffusion facilitator family transporter [Comamonas nitrativorans]|uniref:Cation diffusion facilitator family transporter n=1 Tax=Comamonas nitrativorans TaxID=108437 RepID=A0ABV9H2D4_9BURK
MKAEAVWQRLSPVVLLRASVGVAVLTIVLKMGAWWLTDSVGLLSDALESFVNLAGAMFALLMVTIAQRPADADHPFGHSKAEYFSSGFEGILIIGAALAIIWAAIHRLLNPVPLQALGWGIGLSVVSSVFNGVLAAVMLRSARVHNSMALQADARHLLTDVWTSVGVVAALIAVPLTGWVWLDGAIAIVVALNILKEGGHLIWQSSQGLMDEAIDPEHLQAVQTVLQRHTGVQVYFDSLATRSAGQRSFAQVHMHVPAQWTLGKAARLRRQVEEDLMAAVPGLHATLEILPVGMETALEAHEHQAAARPEGPV